MVNNNRIVPIQRTDFLSLIATILSLEEVSYDLASAEDGKFEITGSGDAGLFLADQPLVSCDFKSGVTAAGIYFVADYDYQGFLTAGSASTMGSGSATVKPDGITLYYAELSSGEVTVAPLTP